MFKRIKRLVIVAGFSATFLAAPAALALDQQPSSQLQPAGSMVVASAQSEIQCGINQAAGTNCSAGAKPSGDLASVIKKVLNLLSAVAGVLAVIMIMVAGLRLVTSAGNEEGVKKAKSTLVYAVVGLILVAVAQILVHFVIHTASS